MEKIEAIIIGAGVVGLAVARAIAQAGHDVLVLEAEGEIGSVTSARNSEVIHAGIYHPPESLMARFCVRGRRALYEFCAAHGVAAQKCGKMIVASDAAESEQLGGILTRARANGVEGIRAVSAADAQAMEPALQCSGALFSPETGIIDSHAYMLALQADAEQAGALFAFHSKVESVRLHSDGFDVVAGGEEIRCTMLVNAAGLHAPDLARHMIGLDQSHLPRAYFCKGSYFTLTGRAPFSRLIYPVPAKAGLGVHLTLDLAGQARFGPDTEWVDTIDYAVDPARSARFYEAIRRYWPGLPDGVLQPGYSGIRPKIVPPDIGKQDFRIDGPAVHGVPGLVNLLGIESPGLTASLAIAGHVRDLIC